MSNTRVLACQIDGELQKRMKEHVKEENITVKDYVTGLIKEDLEKSASKQVIGETVQKQEVKEQPKESEKQTTNETIKEQAKQKIEDTKKEEVKAKEQEKKQEESKKADTKKEQADQKSKENSNKPTTSLGAKKDIKKQQVKKKQKEEEEELE